MAAGSEGEFLSQSQTEKSESGTAKSLSLELSSLLETVLQETTGREDRQSLDLVMQVARKSQHAEANCKEALEELVRAIVDQRFGAKRFSNRLVTNIAASLFESPEAMSRLGKLWQEARKS